MWSRSVVSYEVEHCIGACDIMQYNRLLTMSFLVFCLRRTSSPAHFSCAAARPSLVVFFVCQLTLYIAKDNKLFLDKPQPRLLSLRRENRNVNAGFGVLWCVIIIVIGHSLQRSALVICTEFEYMIMCPTIFILSWTGYTASFTT